jgi:hypothetical protein
LGVPAILQYVEYLRPPAMRSGGGISLWTYREGNYGECRIFFEIPFDLTPYSLTCHMWPLCMVTMIRSCRRMPPCCCPRNWEECILAFRVAGTSMGHVDGSRDHNALMLSLPCLQKTRRLHLLVFPLGSMCLSECTAHPFQSQCRRDCATELVEVYTLANDVILVRE